MYRNMQQVELFTNQYGVVITQPRIEEQNEEVAVVLSPEQIDIMVQWLLIAKDELSQNSKKGKVS